MDLHCNNGHWEALLLNNKVLKTKELDLINPLFPNERAWVQLFWSTCICLYIVHIACKMDVIILTVAFILEG